MKLNTNKSILLIAILIVSVWMFKKTYEKYTSEKEIENLKKQIDTGEMSQVDLDAVMKFIK